MAKHLIRYLLEGNGTVPLFVEDGGYYPINEELVGSSVDSDKRHLPASVQKMTKEELMARISSAAPNKIDGEPKSEEEIEAEADAFIASKLS